MLAAQFHASCTADCPEAVSSWRMEANFSRTATTRGPSSAGGVPAATRSRWARWRHAAEQNLALGCWAVKVSAQAWQGASRVLAYMRGDVRGPQLVRTVVQAWREYDPSLGGDTFVGYVTNDGNIMGYSGIGPVRTSIPFSACS